MNTIIKIGPLAVPLNAVKSYSITHKDCTIVVQYRNGIKPHVFEKGSKEYDDAMSNFWIFTAAMLLNPAKNKKD